MIEHYEKLRQQVLGPDMGGGPRWGQQLLVSRGVVAWMQAAGQLMAPLVPLAPRAGVAPAIWPPLLRQDLVQLMGEVVLAMAEKTKTP